MRRLLLLLAGAILGSALIGFGSPATAQAPKKTTVAAAGGPVAILWSWDPTSATVAKGGKVTWTNDTTAPHNVSAYSDNWEGTLDLDAGMKATYKFKQPGSYLYRCTITTHSEVVNGECIGMCGEVVVE